MGWRHWNLHTLLAGMKAEATSVETVWQPLRKSGTFIIMFSELSASAHAKFCVSFTTAKGVSYPNVHQPMSKQKMAHSRREVSLSCRRMG